MKHLLLLIPFAVTSFGAVIYSDNFDASLGNTTLNADVPGWHFLTGPLPEITRMCEAFGIEFWPEEGLLSHTLQTAVLDRDGRLAGTIEGTAYSGRQLGDLIASVIER